MMIGRQKEGKSTLALQLAIDIGGGGLFLNEHRTRSGKVLYVDFENKPEQIQRRVFDIGKDAAEAEGYTFATVPRSHEQLTVRLHKEPESERFLLVDDRIEFLSAEQREHWAKLPRRFNWAQAITSGVPKGSLARLIRAAKSSGLLKMDGNQYCKAE